MRLPRLRRRDDAADRQPVPFAVGMNRSGTTLLRMMLDAHPQLTIPPETHFVPDLIKACKADDATPESVLAAIKEHREWGDFDFSDQEVLGWFGSLDKLRAGDAVRAFFDAYAGRVGKPRWGDKTPKYVMNMPLIQRALPEAHFIHVIRDGRDVALSVLDRTVRDIDAAHVAGRWKKKVSKAREVAPRLDHYLEIRYEDLILDTEPTLRRVCEFIELEFDPEMLAYHEHSGDRLKEMARELPATGRAKHLSVARRMATHAMTTKPPTADRVSRWRRQMSEEDRIAFEEVAGDLLAELDYPVGEPVEAARAAAGAPADS
jgi:Sulfotransferase family